MALECHVQWMNPSMINEYLMSGARGVWRGSVVRGKRVHGDTNETSRERLSGGKSSLSNLSSPALSTSQTGDARDGGMPTRFARIVKEVHVTEGGMPN